MLKNKNIKNTAVMSELCELLCCPSSHAPESELSRRHEAHHGFVPKRSLRRGKNNKNLSDCNQMVSRDLLDHSQKPVLSKKTRKTLTCAAVLCEHSFKGVAQVLYKQVCQSLPATLEQPTA